MTPPDLPPRQVPRAPLTDVVPKRTLVIIAVVVVLAVLGTVIGIVLGGGDDDNAGGSEGGGGSRTVAGGSASAGTKEDKNGGTGSDDSGSDTAKAGGTTGTTPSGSATTAGGTGSDVSATEAGEAATTHEGGRYSIGLPKGWKFQSSDSAGDRFTGPDGQKLLVAWTTTPKDDPVADWKNQERYMERSQYKKIRIEAVDYRGWNTADWEFTYQDGGTKYRTIDRGFVVSDSQGYALMYTAKAAQWGSDLRESTWKTLTESFTPKK